MAIDGASDPVAWLGIFHRQQPPGYLSVVAPCALRGRRPAA